MTPGYDIVNTDATGEHNTQNQKYSWISIAIGEAWNTRMNKERFHMEHSL